jgi:hypothetical protein
MGPSPFLKPGDFTQGKAMPEPQTGQPPVSTGHASFIGDIVFTNVDVNLAQALLPAGLGLRVAPNLAQPALHPLVHIVGQQTKTGWSSGGFSQSVDQPYDEFILLVPFVLAGANPQWHNFVVRMYLDDQIAQLLGLLFAYRKRTGFVRGFPRAADFPPVAYDVFVDGTTAFSCEHVTEGTTYAGTDAPDVMPNFDAMHEIMRMPALGIDPTTGQGLCSYFRWDFKPARVTPIATEHRYDTGFAPGEVRGLPLRSVIDGGFCVDGLGWRLTLPPYPCQLGPGSGPAPGSSGPTGSAPPLP